VADPHVDEVLEQERAIRVMAGSRQRVSWVKRFFFSSLFYTSLAGMFAAFIGWAVIEPFFEDITTISGTVREVLPDYTMAVCPVCEEIVPVSVNSSARLQCPTCKGDLVIDPNNVVQGLLKLDKTNVFLIPTTYLVSLKKDAQATSLIDEIPVSTPIRVKGMVVDKRSMVALKIEIVKFLDRAKEPDLKVLTRRNTLIALTWFGIIGGMIGLMIGAVEGFVCLNIRQALLCGGIGLGIGAAGGLIGIYPAGVLYSVVSALSGSLAGEAHYNTIYDMHGWALLTQIVGRSLAWGVVGMSLGIGQGIARKSKKMIVNGLLGGCVGGLLGGLFFDPIAKLAGTDGAELSRCVGFAMIGFLVGLLVGLVEQLLKQVWLLMRTGPLSGKQFIAYKDEITIGSVPRCDIYLFRDTQVSDEHARLVRLGRAYQIETLQEAHEVFINGESVQKRILRDGDLIRIGTTELEYRNRGG
jgi:hypothetical protein